MSFLCYAVPPAMESAGQASGLHLDQLPELVLQEIAQHCSRYTLLRCRLVCKHWRECFSQHIQSVHLDISATSAAEASAAVTAAEARLQRFPKLDTAVVTFHHFLVSLAALLETGITRLTLKGAVKLLKLKWDANRPELGYIDGLLPFASNLRELRLQEVIEDWGVNMYDAIGQLTALTSLWLEYPRTSQTRAVDQIPAIIPGLSQLQEAHFAFPGNNLDALVQTLNACAACPQIRKVCASLWTSEHGAVLLADIKDRIRTQATADLPHISLTIRGTASTTVWLPECEYIGGEWFINGIGYQAMLMGGGHIAPSAEQVAEQMQERAGNCDISNVHSVSMSLSVTHEPPAPILVDLSSCSKVTECSIVPDSDAKPFALAFNGVSLLTTLDIHGCAALDICATIQSISWQCPKLVHLHLHGELKGSCDSLRQLTSLTKLHLDASAKPPPPVLWPPRSLDQALSAPPASVLRVEWLPHSLSFLQLVNFSIWYLSARSEDMHMAAVSGVDTPVQLSNLQSLILNRCVVWDLNVFCAARSSLCYLHVAQCCVIQPAGIDAARAMFPELIKLVYE